MPQSPNFHFAKQLLNTLNGVKGEVQNPDFDILQSFREVALYLQSFEKQKFL